MILVGEERRTNERRGERSSMKVEITVNIKKADGTFAAESTTMEVDVPDFEEFTGPDEFGKIFNKYERNVLKARNEVVAAATEKYLNELAKKKQRQQQ
jgi:hypothetical protein